MRTLFKVIGLLCKKMATVSIHELSNTDEVPVLYSSFPSRVVRLRDAPATFKIIKNRLTAVLTVSVDGIQGPLTVIGTSKQPRSFPRHFDLSVILEYSTNGRKMLG